MKMIDNCFSEYLDAYCQHGIDRQQYEALILLWQARKPIAQDDTKKLNKLYSSLDPLAKKYVDKAIAGEGQCYDDPLAETTWYFHLFMQGMDEDVKFLGGDLPWDESLDGAKEVMGADSCFVKRGRVPSSGLFVNGNSPTVCYHPEDKKKFGDGQSYKSIFEMVLIGGWGPD